MSKRVILLKILFLLSLEVFSINNRKIYVKNTCIQMVQDSALYSKPKEDTVSLHKVWKLNYVNKLHPIFLGLNTGYVETEWNIVDFTNPDTVKIFTKEGDEYSHSYKIVNKELVFPMVDRKKKLKSHEARITMHISQLTAHQLGITLYLHPNKNKKNIEGNFVEWVFENVQ